MGEVEEYTFEELCQVVGAIAAEYGILRVYLFGSRARGDNRPDSDYDFCVKTPKGMGLFMMGGFYGKLEEALGKGSTSCAKDPSVTISASPYPRT
ncbi:MAG: nucleotidyltransferase domain-containing protein [Candidatus Methanomethylophilaceae archaeon]|nr:nucleotidyltransferase domain-containing protein [Candidatus Methanomethylophilaceae archaeon]